MMRLLLWQSFPVADFLFISSVKLCWLPLSLLAVQIALSASFIRRRLV
jgi:hypothetical protein